MFSISMSMANQSQHEVAMPSSAISVAHPAAAALALGGGGIGVGLSTSGFLGMFFIGAIAALERLSIINASTTSVAGASGGSLAGVMICLGVRPEIALAIAHDLMRICLPRRSCAGFLDKVVRVMLNATLAAAVAGTGEIPVESLKSTGGLGGWGVGGNATVPLSLLSSSGPALRTSASPEYWRVSDRLVQERCSGRLHIVVSELINHTAGKVHTARVGRAADAAGGLRREALGGGGNSSTRIKLALATNSSAAVLASSPLPPRLLLLHPNLSKKAANAVLGCIRVHPCDSNPIGLPAQANSVRVPFEPQLPTSAMPYMQPPRAHWAPSVLSVFASAVDLIDIAASSSFVPVFSGPSITTPLRGKPVADGMFADAMPCPPGVGYCVRISAALPGEPLVRGTPRIINPDIAPGLRVQFPQTLRQWQARALSAPTVAVGEALVWLGEREAEAWAIEVGLGTMTRVIEQRAKQAAKTGSDPGGNRKGQGV
jgi:hypothetical protein